MELSTSQQTVIQKTFTEIVSNSDPFILTFFEHLFELDPALKDLFKIDLMQQGSVLIRMLMIAVEGLDHPADLLPALHDLGAHHAGFGVKPQDYETFRNALMQALADILGAEFTPEAAEAWDAFYKILAAGSIEGLQR